MEHRHHRQHGVARRQRHAVGQRRRHGVQQAGAVAVHGAFRVAGRARGVADARRRVLIEAGPAVVAVLGLDQLLEAQQVRHAGLRRHVGAIRHRDEVAHRRQLRGELLDQRQEAQVETQHLVLGVVDDPGDLLREQPRVDGVAHQARAGRGVIDLEMAVAVPGQRADTVTRLATQPGQGLRQLAGAQFGVDPGVAMHVALDALGDDLGVAMVTRRVRDQRRDQQRHLHHLPHQQGHGRSLFGMQLNADDHRKRPARLRLG